MRATTKKVYKIRVKKGDIVVVTSGSEKGKTGKVTQTHPSLNMVTVEGINVVKRHVKPNRQNPRGSIVELTKPVNVSKVAVFEPTKKRPSRIKYNFDKNGNKVRQYVVGGKEITS